ncbi:HesA/MoeB/ThiF family protein [Dyadobacter luticola]|uniref:Molybdopterin-synthase adenylyltransferase n=1 Tax=Dyadobacter luticola TaxID=1979387 RepID=A0A5R9KTN1_9BACT|nr:HesA/MoeB/ThiF family protein [Dyadobacter luticola]TLU99436.1 molybdopterin-synthase adenylyltransferase MoeB [Dyadobacter luticola]
MLEKQERKRYSRQILLPEMGLSGQEKLKAAKVLVVGAGGLGCPVLQYLAAAGVGAIGIVDDDLVDITNLHRQILYTSGDIGQNKALTAAEKLSALNPFVKITPYPVRLSEENAETILKNYDLIIDGSDNFITRYLVNDFCIKLGKPFVFGSILRFEGQVSVFNFQNGPTYRCLFPDFSEEDNCAEAGVIGILPGMIGTYMANEAIKVITGIGEPLSGKLLVINALTNTTSIFQFSRSVNAGAAANFQVQEPEPTPKPSVSEISWEAFESLQQAHPEKVELIDVREPHEFEADGFGGVNIPLSEIPDHLHSFAAGKTVIFYCNTGKRSLRAATLLVESGFEGQSFWGQNW